MKAFMAARRTVTMFVLRKERLLARCAEFVSDVCDVIEK